MMYALAFALCLVVYGTNGNAVEKPNVSDVAHWPLVFQSGDLPCHFDSYDLDGNGDISAKEFMLATGGIGHIDSKELFGRLDKDGDETIVIEEFTHADPSLAQTGIFDHCSRVRCWAVCIHIG